MNPNWQKKRLEDVCVFINGLWKGIKPPFQNVGVIRNTNFTKEGMLDDSDIAYIDVEKKKFEKRRLQIGDLILERSGGGPKQPVGRVVLFDLLEGDFSFSNFTSALRVKDRESLDPRYLHKFLHWVYVSGTTEKMQSHTTGIRNLNFDTYKSIEVSFPGIEEQKRIVSVLDKVFDGIATANANTEKNLENARGLFQGCIDEAFSRNGFTEQPLGQICVVKDGTHDSPKYVLKGIPFVTQKNITDDGLSFSNTKFISQTDHDSFYRRSNVSYGDVLISMIGANRGMACVVDDPRIFSIKNVGLVKKNDTIDQYYILYFLKSSKAADYVRANSRGGAQEFIGLTELRAFPIPTTSLPQ